jgi:mannose-6-phosphate isomerase-like protein (cupin superfamily)
MTANDGAFNLTALAYRHRSDRPAHVLPVLEHGAFSATILRPLPGEPFEEGPALTDTIYIVIAGFGCLGSGDKKSVEATAGDVLFVPAGRERRFTKLSRKFEVWRIRYNQSVEYRRHDAIIA